MNEPLPKARPLQSMRAMVLDQPGRPLRETQLPIPEPAGQEVLIRVSACGVCRTDLHIVDGELPAHKLPLVPGHQIVGVVVEKGPFAAGISVGDRVGVPWLGSTCNACRFCGAGRENLCEHAAFTGYDRDGGYAQYALADSRYCFPLPENLDDVHAAPLLCAGLIGYRAYMMLGDAKCIGLYGFGAAAHIVAQVALQQGKTVYAFTRPGDLHSQRFALSLGADWAGDSASKPPGNMDGAIIFASDGSLVPAALASVEKGGNVVCAGIHMSDIPSFPYSLLWGERAVRSVANLTRADGENLFSLLRHLDIQTSPQIYPLCEANQALQDLREGKFDGAAVLLVEHEQEAASVEGPRASAHQAMSHACDA